MSCSSTRAEVLEDLRDGPAVGRGACFAKRGGDGFDRRPKRGAIRVEVAQQLFGAWVHPEKLHRTC